MAKKIAFRNENAPDLSSLFSWGLKVTNIRELFFVTGTVAVTPKFKVKHPGDAVAQAKDILNNVDSFIKKAGYSRDDIVRFNQTSTKEVKPNDSKKIFGLVEKFFEDVQVKPAAGTYRVVHALAVPGLLVEFEFLVAK